MPFVSHAAVNDAYDVVIAGTGFGAAFYIHRLLRDRPDAKILMLEWGEFRTSNLQREERRHSNVDPESTFVRRPGEKPWDFTIGFGGGFNCWGGQSPRLHPNDFRLKSRYGVGVDWPVSYDDLEPYYLEAEQIMLVAGSNDIAKHYPRSGPFPQPPHRMSTVDHMLKAAMPDLHFANASARLTVPVPGRASCCASDDCSFCPMEARFTLQNSLMHLFEGDNVHVLLGAKVLAVETAGKVATAVRYQVGGTEKTVRGELIALACNAIQTPFIMMRSGMTHPKLGRFLHEKRVLQFEAFLDGLDHFDGGQPVTGLNLSLLDGEHRREAGAAMIGIKNSWRAVPTREGLRAEFGRWRQILPLEIFVEDLPMESNGVFDEGGDLPVVHHPAFSEYSQKGIDRVVEKLPDVLAALPVERIRRLKDAFTGSHVQGSVRMGTDPSESIVDADLLHHDYRNLLVLGTAVFPTCGTGNPSLTAAALSLRSAERLSS